MAEKKESEETTEPVKKSDKKIYALVQVPTEHQNVIQTPNDEYLTTEQALVVILNKLELVEQTLG